MISPSATSVLGGLNNPFEILDNIGSPRIFDIHPHRNLIAYESGNGILLWDIESDKKVRLHKHENEVQCVFFIGQGGKLILSVDGGTNVNIFLSDWENIKRVQEIPVPPRTVSSNSASQQRRRVRNIVGAYNKYSNMLMLVENEQGNSVPPRLSIWRMLGQNLHLAFIGNMDTSISPSVLSSSVSEDTSVIAIDTFGGQASTAQGARIAVAYVDHLKFFVFTSVNQATLCLTNRVHLKESIVGMCVNQTCNLAFVLLRTGKVLFIDSEGELVGQLRHDSASFTSLTSFEQSLYCGSDSGSIFVYDISTKKLLQEFNWKTDSSNTTKKSSKRSSIAMQIPSASGDHASLFDYKVQAQSLKEKQSVGSSVILIRISEDGNIMTVMYSDGTSLILDRVNKAPLQSFVGHTESINSITWDTAGRQRFFAISDDGRLSQWNFNGDRWLPQMVLSSFSQELMAQRRQSSSISSSTGEFIGKDAVVRPKSICLDVKRDVLYCGDNKGNLTTFDVSGSLPVLSRVFSLSSSSIAIVSLKLSPAGSCLVVLYATGSVSIYSVQENFEQKSVLESPTPKQLLQPRSSLSVFENSIRLNTLSFKEQYSNPTQVNTLLDKSSISSYSNLSKDVNSGARKSRQYYQSSKSDTHFQVATQHSQNTIRIHSLSVTPTQTLTATVSSTFVVEGSIQSFDVHPSNQYFVVVSNVGLVYVFSLKSSELRGKVEIPLHSQNISIDPSGLYFTITTIGNSADDKQPRVGSFNRSISSLQSKSDLSGLGGRNNLEVDQFFTKKPDSILPVKVQLYEIGTGNLVGEIPNIFIISSISFSSDGRFLTVGSARGIVSIWQTCEEAVENIEEVLSQMRLRDDFWQEYPLYLSPKENILQDLDETRSLKEDENQFGGTASQSKFQLKNNYAKEPETGTIRSNQPNNYPTRPTPLFQPLPVQFQQTPIEQKKELFTIQSNVILNIRNHVNENVQSKKDPTIEFAAYVPFQQKSLAKNASDSLAQPQIIVKAPSLASRPWKGALEPQNRGGLQEIESNFDEDEDFGRKLQIGSQAHSKQQPPVQIASVFDIDSKQAPSNFNRFYRNSDDPNRFSASDRMALDGLTEEELKQAQQNNYQGFDSMKQFAKPLYKNALAPLIPKHQENNQFSNQAKKDKQVISFLIILRQLQRSDDPDDIDDDLEDSPHYEMNGRYPNQQQQHQRYVPRQQQNIQFDEHNKLGSISELDIPSPSSLNSSEASDIQYDQIDRFQRKLKVNKQMS